MSTVTIVDVCRTLIGTAHLHRSVSDFLAPTVGAALLGNGFGLNVVSLNGLHTRLQFLAQMRWEIGRLCLCDDSF